MKNSIFLFFLFFLNLSLIRSQSLERVYPFERYGQITALKILPNGIGYAVVEEHSLLKTTDGGLSWNEEILLGDAKQKYLLFLDFFDENNPDKFITAGNYDILLTENGGQSFRNIRPSGSTAPGILRSFALTSSGRFFIGTGEGLFYTDDEGDSWQTIDNSAWWRVIYEADSALFFATKTGLFRSTDNGTSIDSLIELPEAPRFITSYNDNIWVQTSSQLLFSADNGNTWNLKTATGMASGIGLEAIDQNTIFSITNNRIWWSEDGGNQWQNNQLFPDNRSGFSRLFLDNENGIWIGGDSKRIIYSPGLNQPFQKRGPGKYEDLRTITGHGNEIWATGEYGIMMYSNNSGEDWQEIQLDTLLRPWHVFKTENKVVIIENQGEVFYFNQDGSTEKVHDFGNRFALNVQMRPDRKFLYGFTAENSMTTIHRSGDEGKTWNAVYTHPKELVELHFFENGKLGAHTSDGDILYSADNGSSWTLQVATGTNVKKGILLNETEGILLFGTSNAIVSTDGWQTFEQISALYNGRDFVREGWTDKIWGLGYNSSDSWLYEGEGVNNPFRTVGSPGSVQQCEGLWYDPVKENLWLVGEGLNIEVIRRNPVSNENINSSEDSLRFTAFPNPTSGEIFIEFSSKQKAVFQLFDLSGRLILERENFQSDQINLQFLNKGVYLAVLKTADNVDMQLLTKIK